MKDRFIERNAPDGYCIEMFDESVWLTQDLKITPDYGKRGIWKTFEEAQEAMKEALKEPQL